MPRRHEGIRQLKSGKWQARIAVTENGVTRQISVGTYDKLIDAKDARNLALAQRRQGTFVDPAGSRITVETWMRQWQTLRRVKPTQYLKSALAVHILPTFGQRRLGDITPLEVQQWVNGMVDRPLKPATVVTYYGIFRQAMEAAVDLDVLPRSPCRAIILPKVKRTLPEPVTVEQVLALEAAVQAQQRGWPDTRPGARPAVPTGPMIHLMAWCGLRWGEVTALRWENVDLGTRIIHVVEAQKEEGGIGLPKGDKTRVVPMGHRTAEVLAQHRRDYGGSGLLFPNRMGKPYHHNAYRRHIWNPCVQQVFGRLGVTPHDLRHAYATHAVQSGVDAKVLSEAMGHHAPSFTMDRYGLARSDGHAVLADSVDAAMGER